MQNIIELKISPSNRIQWDTSIVVVVLHAMAIWALFAFSWQNPLAVLVLWWVTNSWSIGMSYHRLLTQGGCNAPK